jgi:hypothetical protein
MTGGGFSGGGGGGKGQNNFPSPQYGMPSPQGGGQRGYHPSPGISPQPMPMLNGPPAGNGGGILRDAQGGMGVRNLGGPTMMPGATTGGNMAGTAPAQTGGAPPGMVADPTRTGGVRPWDAPGFDPTHGGPFYKPAPQSPGMPTQMPAATTGGNMWQDPRNLSSIGKGGMPPAYGQKPGQPPAPAQQPAATAPSTPDYSGGWQGGN